MVEQMHRNCYALLTSPNLFTFFSGCSYKSQYKQAAHKYQVGGHPSEMTAVVV